MKRFDCFSSKIKRCILYIEEFGIVLFVKRMTQKKIKNKERLYATIKEKLKKDCAETLYKYANCGKNQEQNQIPAEKKIWFFWWQGIESAPKLVQCCYKSIVANSGTYDVVLVTGDNYAQYVSLPDIVLERFQQGYISLTHISDIVRMHLLRDYGGIWMDASSFVSEAVPDTYMEPPLMSKKKANNKFVAEGKWLIGLLATNCKHMILFDYMCEAYEEYFKKHKRLVDYFLTDYLISLAYDNISEISDIIDAIPENNISSRMLWTNINNPFDAQLWSEICKNTWFHSLSWKKKLVKEVNQQDTFYKKIVCKYSGAEL